MNEQDLDYLKPPTKYFHTSIEEYVKNTSQYFNKESLEKLEVICNFCYTRTTLGKLTIAIYKSKYDCVAWVCDENCMNLYILKHSMNEISTF